MQKALLGAGCFWGVQYYFDQIPGVVKTTAGYSGGREKDPTYEQVAYHKTGHAEVVLVEFDESIINYQQILKHFFRMHNPTILNRDGPNIGTNYRSVIFYFDDAQKLTAQKVLQEAQKNNQQKIVTEITEASEFYSAEDEHQKFTEKTGIGACHIPYKPL